jgi:hypothetical protein
MLVNEKLKKAAQESKRQFLEIEKSSNNKNAVDLSSKFQN